MKRKGGWGVYGARGETGPSGRGRKVVGGGGGWNGVGVFCWWGVGGERERMGVARRKVGVAGDRLWTEAKVPLRGQGVRVGRWVIVEGSEDHGRTAVSTF